MVRQLSNMLKREPFLDDQFGVDATESGHRQVRGRNRTRAPATAATLSPGVAYRYASLWLRNWAELEECIGDFAKPVFAVRRANSNRLIGVNS